MHLVMHEKIYMCTVGVEDFVTNVIVYLSCRFEGYSTDIAPNEQEEVSFKCLLT